MPPPKRPVPLSKLARRLDVHLSTVHRWRQRGVRGTKLACVRIGGRWFATREAISAFLTALNGGAIALAAEGEATRERRAAREAAEAAAVEQRLIARGL